MAVISENLDLESVQADILQLLITQFFSLGYWLSFQDVCDMRGFASKNNVSGHVARMVKKGLLAKPEGINRAFQLRCFHPADCRFGKTRCGKVRAYCSDFDTVTVETIGRSIGYTELSYQDCVELCGSEENLFTGNPYENIAEAFGG